MQTIAQQEIKLFFKKHKELIKSIRSAKKEAIEEIESLIAVLNSMKKIEKRIAFKQEDIYCLEMRPLLIRTLPVLKFIVKDFLNKKRRDNIKLSLNLSEYSIVRSLDCLDRWVHYMETINKQKILNYNKKIRKERLMAYYLRRKNEANSKA